MRRFPFPFACASAGLRSLSSGNYPSQISPRQARRDDAPEPFSTLMSRCKSRRRNGGCGEGLPLAWPREGVWEGGGTQLAFRWGRGGEPCWQGARCLLSWYHHRQGASSLKDLERCLLQFQIISLEIRRIRRCKCCPISLSAAFWCCCRGASLRVDRCRFESAVWKSQNAFWETKL